MEGADEDRNIHTYIHIYIYTLNFDAMVPVEQAATIRPCTFKLGFSNFTSIHPRIPPIKKVSPMLIGINHLHRNTHI